MYFIRNDHTNLRRRNHEMVKIRKEKRANLKGRQKHPVDLKIFYKTYCIINNNSLLYFVIVNYILSDSCLATRFKLS